MAANPKGRLPWFRCVPTALLGAMAGLDVDENMIYLTALLRIYETGGPVPETAKTLGRRCGMPERRAGAALQRLVAAGKLTIDADGRVDSDSTHEELEWQQATVERKTAASHVAATVRSKKTDAKSPVVVRAEKTQRNQQNGSSADDRLMTSWGPDIDRDINPPIPPADPAPADAPPAAPAGGVPERVSELARDNPVALYQLLAGSSTTGKPKRAKPAPATEPLAAEFAELWELFPKREGANPRKTAEAAYVKARSRGVERATIEAGIRAFAAEWRSQPKDRLRYVPQAVTWLNQERWGDAGPARAAAAEPARNEPLERHKLEMFRSRGTWPIGWGPRPGEAGCTSPEHLLAEYGFTPETTQAKAG